jgi:hypothetical protein
MQSSSYISSTRIPPYRDYKLTLLSSDHYPCLQPTCLEKKFVVFPTDVDLRAHVISEVSKPAFAQPICLSTDLYSMESKCPPGTVPKPANYPSISHNQPIEEGLAKLTPAEASPCRIPPSRTALASCLECARRRRTSSRSRSLLP